jgi:hypothetical protein
MQKISDKEIIQYYGQIWANTNEEILSKSL